MSLRNFPTTLPVPPTDNFEELVREPIIRDFTLGAQVDAEIATARGGYSDLTSKLEAITAGDTNLEGTIAESIARANLNQITITGGDYTSILNSGDSINLTYSDGTNITVYVLHVKLDSSDSVIEIDRDTSSHLTIASATYTKLDKKSIPRLDNFPLLQESQKNYSSNKTGIVIPLYIYPTDVFTNSDYNNLIDLKKKYPDVPMIAIVNPSSGPGSSVDGNYEAAIDRLKGAGIQVSGYVSTDYTNNSISSVKTDIDKWLELYPKIDSLFLDEMTNDSDNSHAEYYSELTRYGHQSGLYPVMGNPGANQLGLYFEKQSADVIFIHENSTTPTITDIKGDFDGGHMEHHPKQRGAILYDKASIPWTSDDVSAGEAYISELSKYCGWLYITDDSGANPYDTVSSHMEDLLAYCNTVGNDSLFISGDGHSRLGNLHDYGWGSTYAVHQLGGNSALFGLKARQASNSFYIGQNVYHDGSNFKYMSTDEASLYTQSGGGHTFSVAASGSNDATISFTSAMHINSSGNVGIGTTSPVNNLHVFEDSAGSISALGFYDDIIVESSSLSGIQLRTADNSASGISFSSPSNQDAGRIVYGHSGDALSDAFAFFVNGSQQAALSSTNLSLTGVGLIVTGGNVGIGAGSPSAKLQVSGGDLLLDNSRFYQLKDSGGTARNVLTIDGSNNVLIRSQASNDIRLTPAGEVELPSHLKMNNGTQLYFNSINQCGIEGSTASGLRYIVGGAEVAFMDTAGLSGFGRRSANRTLEVDSSFAIVASSSGILELGSSPNSTDSITMLMPDTSFGSHTSGDGMAIGNFNGSTTENLEFWNANGKRVVIATNGEVGINTTDFSGDNKLVVSDSSGGDINPFCILNPGDTNALKSVGMIFDLASTAGSRGTAGRIGAVMEQSWIGSVGVANSTVDSSLVFYTTHAGTSSESMRITSEDLLGIGTSSPNQRIHLHQSDSNQNFMQFTNTATGTAGNNGFLFGLDSSEAVRILNYGNSDMLIATADTNRLIIKNTGELCTGGETAPDVDTGGLCLNHGANDGNVLTFKNSDVAHGATGIAETDTYAEFSKISSSNGGLLITTIGENEESIYFRSVATSEDTSTSSSSDAPFTINSQIKDGTGFTSVSASGNIAVWSGGGGVVGMLKGDGDIYTATDQTAGLTGTFDTYDDQELVDSARYLMGHSDQRDKVSKENRERLHDLGIMKNGFISHANMHRLHLGMAGQSWNMLRHSMGLLGIGEATLKDFSKNYGTQKEIVGDNVFSIVHKRIDSWESKFNNLVDNISTKLNIPKKELLELT